MFLTFLNHQKNMSNRIVDNFLNKFCNLDVNFLEMFTQLNVELSIMKKLFGFYLVVKLKIRLNL